MPAPPVCSPPANRLESRVRKAVLKDAGLTARTRSPPLVTPRQLVILTWKSWATPVLSGIENLQRRHRQHHATVLLLFAVGKPQGDTDALHLLLAYELDRTEQNGGPPSRRRIETHHPARLEVDLKFEFNKKQPRVYGKGCW